MNPLRKGVDSNGKIIAILIIIFWAFFAALIHVKPTPRLILPFLALNGILLILFPFKTYFPIFAVMSFAYPSFMLISKIGGRTVEILELFLIFLIVVMFIEVIWKDFKFKLTPISFLICIFLILTAIQIYRGVSFGYKLPLVRTAGRNLAMWSVFLPMSVYLQNTDNAEKLIKYCLIGWGLGSAFYILSYLGIFTSSGIYVPNRPFWPSTLNIAIFFPLLILLIIPFERGLNRPNYIYHGGLLILSLLILIPTQARTIYVLLAIQIVVLSVITTLVQKKGQKYIYFLKVIFVFAIVGVLSVILLKIFMGENFDILVQTLLRRFDTANNLRSDLSLNARRWQVYESMIRIRGHWIFGRGIGFEWNSFKGIYKIDNLYFALLIHFGLVGLGVFAIIIGLWFHRGVWLIIHRDELESYFLKAFVLSQPAVILAILSTGFTGSGFAYTTSNVTIMVYWIILTEYFYIKLRRKKISPPVPKTSEA